MQFGQTDNTNLDFDHFGYHKEIEQRISKSLPDHVLSDYRLIVILVFKNSKQFNCNRSQHNLRTVV
jgi:hypothetical protein